MPHHELGHCTKLQTGQLQMAHASDKQLRATPALYSLVANAPQGKLGRKSVHWQPAMLGPPSAAKLSDMTAPPLNPVCAAAIAGKLPYCQAQLAGDSCCQPLTGGSRQEFDLYAWAETRGTAQCVLLSVSVCPVCLLRLKRGSTLQQSRAEHHVSNDVTMANIGAWHKAWHRSELAHCPGSLYGKGAWTSIIKLMTRLHWRTTGYQFTSHGRLLCLLNWSVCGLCRYLALKQTPETLVLKP